MPTPTLTPSLTPSITPSTSFPVDGCIPLVQEFRRYSDGVKILQSEIYDQARGIQFIQSTVSTTWQIQHNKNSKMFKANVFIDNKLCIADIIIIDENNISIAFNQPTSGFVNILFLDSFTPKVCINNPMPSPTPSPVLLNPFIMNVTNGFGYTLYACGASNNASVDWGDGTIDNIPDGSDDGSDDACSNGIIHTYATVGDYTIKIYGDYFSTTINFGGISFELLDDDPGESASTVASWGTYNIHSISLPMDIINVPNSIPTTLTNLTRMFKGSSNFNQDLSSWNTSNVTNMSQMFAYSGFNQNINSWDVSNVTNMSQMFSSTTNFNQDLPSWNTSNVTNMDSMFANCATFNGNIISWNVSNVTSMNSMFSGATIFNQNISGWDVSNVTDMTQMFNQTAAFNIDISSWNVSNVISMVSTFRQSIFNQNISSWDVSNVTNMFQMFSFATNFNQDLSSWNTGNVTSMSGMFGGASAFNSDISTWNTNKVTTTRNMFNGATNFNQDISSWDTSNVTDMISMFQNASTFNKDLSGWCVTNIASLPTNFDTGASSWILSRPVWGTCPP